MTGRHHVLVCLLLVTAVAPAAAAPVPHDPGASTDLVEGHATTTDAAVSDGDLHLTTAVALTPNEPGRIRATLTFSIPDRVVSMKTQLPADATLLSMEGFSRQDGSFVWDQQTASPTITVSLPANRTAQEGGPLAAEGSYLFVDTGPWAIVRNPPVSVQWSRRGTTPVRFSQQLTVDGEGAAGRTVAYLGPYERHTHTASGQTFELVVPASANMAESPSAVFASLADASSRLHVGERDERVFVVAAPTGRVSWAVRGLEVGGADFWVRAPEKLSDPGNVWLHEYVHTRQGFTTAESGRWFTEASATWYAAVLTLEQGRIGFPEFARYLRVGSTDPRGSAVLSRPSTWVKNANYLKGGLVLGELDRRIRTATDHGKSLQAVFARLNGASGPIENSDIVTAVGDAGTADTRQAAERFTTTEAAPEMWSESAHEQAFGPTPAVFDVSVAKDATRITGPYRNVSATPPVTLVTGETLRLTVPVKNVGGTRGNYDVAMQVGNETVATRSGRLGPDESVTLQFAHTFDRPGEYVVTVGSERVRVQVTEPAEPKVTKAAVDRTAVSPGGSVTLTATLQNPADVPAVGTVRVRRDGTVVAERRVVLAPGESREMSVPVRLEEPGKHEIAIGNIRLTVEVTEKATSPRPTRRPVPGFGATAGLAGVAGLALLGVLFGRR